MEATESVTRLDICVFWHEAFYIQPGQTFGSIKIRTVSVQVVSLCAVSVWVLCRYCCVGKGCVGKDCVGTP